MGFNNPDRLINAALPAETVLALQDQATGLGNLATQPSGGGTSMTTTGNCFEFAGSQGNGADTTEDTLATFTLPANALDQAKRGVYIYAWGSYANTPGTKAAKLYFGSTSLAAATGQNLGWALEFAVLKSAANTQQISGQNIVGTVHGGVTNTANASNTDTAGIVIKVTGQNSTSSNANTIVLNGMYVQFMN
jgi:hypothetical protein